ncbi:histidine phosphatase family protein [Rhabdochromatium marinum]|uniref:histidine phosphatase family protein n=1 Tax=Rhabdochromatium marinum TaxID=48729 RepID=UPI0019036466|nr:histidine phosphatase family protein [Rhabdochromatium marinum]MBK1650559.1 hypothetical protein [Rhabdochromatium marinum]
MKERLIDVLRHGEVQGGPCFRGRRDDPLTARGWRQMQGALQDLSGRYGARWDYVMSSPAVRCQAFARTWAAERALPLVEQPAFAERDFGAWEGLSASEIPLAELSAFWSDPQSFDPPEAEPFVVFRRRVAEAWQSLLAADWHHGLLFTHGGVTRIILGEALGLADASLLLLEVPPAGVTRWRLPVGGGLPSLVAHLPPVELNEEADEAEGAR